MLNEITPEQMTRHIAAMRAEPWGEERQDYRAAYTIYWLFNLLGSTEDDRPEAEDFLAGLKAFIDSKSTKEKAVVLSPEQAAAQSREIF